MKTPTVSFGVRVPQSERDRLDAVYQKRGYRDRNEAIKAMIAQFLQEETPEAAA